MAEKVEEGNFKEGCIFQTLQISYCKIQNAKTLFLFRKKKTCAKRKTKRMFLVKVFTKPLPGLRGRGAEPHKGKKVVD
ncbi:MAG: hypothetical protein KAV25_05345, partial [Methanophagales archaeon]|nr:hypothetical protein [Methanophagales archaeon]